jgi:hypothetical protein
MSLLRKSLIATAVLMSCATAQAATYRVEGVTIHVPSNCASTSCVSVSAPGYGYIHSARRSRPHKAHGDVKDAAVPAKKDKKEETAAAPTAAPAPTAEPAPVAKVDAKPAEAKAADAKPADAKAADAKPAEAPAATAAEAPAAK